MGQTKRKPSRPGRVPPSAGRRFESLLRTASRLQGPGGCPWDHAQTVETLLPCLIEESWETFQAARAGHAAHLAEELGDLFYTVLFVAMKAEAEGRFTVADMLDSTRRKMVRRHPHVFGKKAARTAAQAFKHWQAIKKAEGRPAVSQSKRLRVLLVALWDRLLRQPGFAAELRSALRED